MLKVFNAAYQLNRAGVVYSNFYLYDPGRQVKGGFSMEYTPEEKKNLNFRSVPKRWGYLRTFRA